jgi:diguanylate cyclase
MLHWLAHDDTAPAEPMAPVTAPPATATNIRALANRQLFEEVGSFLATYDLTPNPRNFAFAHAHLSGGDWELSARIDAHLAEHGTLSDDDAARLSAQRGGAELTPTSLSDVAQLLAEQIAACVSAVDQSYDCAASFGSALDAEAKRMEAGEDALQRVIALTRDAVQATRLVESQLQHTRMEADRLRADLQRARRAAEEDHLTGLPNRRSFEARLHRIAGGPPTDVATVALCDIDDFKQVNDQFGHPAGDRVLKYVGRFLRAQLGRDVFVARFGGEEFACLFPHDDPQRAHRRLDAARDKLAHRSLVNQENGQPIGSITLSAGVATMRPEAVEEAMNDADAALYTAKRNGKNMVVIAR